MLDIFNGCCPPECRQAGRQDPKRPISKSAILARAPIGAIVAVPNVGLDLNIYTLYTIYQFGVREREREKERDRQKDSWRTNLCRKKDKKFKSLKHDETEYC